MSQTDPARHAIRGDSTVAPPAGDLFSAASPGDEPDPARRRLVKHLERRSFIGALVVMLCLAIVVVLLGYFVPTVWAIGGFAGLSVVGSAAVSRRVRAELTRLFDHEDRLVRSIAHEVRRPLQRVITAADLGLAGVIPIEEALEGTVRHAETLSELFGDLVEAAQLLSGTRTLVRQQLGLAALVARAEELFGSSQITVAVEGGNPEVIVNPHLIRLVMVNLLRNAADHGYGGAAGTVGVELREDGVVVRDSGQGIEPAQLSRIQHGTVQSMRRSGAGIGLSLAAWVADIHGGRLTIDNRDEGGVAVGLFWSEGRAAAIGKSPSA